MHHDQTITLYQPLLQSIAVRMVGCVQDAEDIVHDTFLKWLSVDTSNVTNTKAYLIKAVTNNCLNHLDSLKRKKDDLLENLKPSELIEKYKEKEILHFDLENEVSAALAVMHRKLEPVEKAVYILREVFNIDYDELQELVDRKKDNCRQLFCRAKEKLGKESIKFKVNIPRHIEMMESFKKACDLGNISDLVSDLSHDIKEKFHSVK